MTDGLEYLGRARVQGLVLLVLAFVVGALAGAAGDRLWTRSQSAPRPAAPRTEEPRPQEQREGAPRLPKVLEDMNLTSAQRAAIDSILASGRPRNEAILNTVLPQLRAVSDSLHQGIRAVLTPQQAAEFDTYLRSHRPPTPPPPPQAGVVGGATGGERRAGDRPPRRPDGPDGRERPERPDDRDGCRPPPPPEDGDRQPPPPPPPPGGGR